MWIDPPHYFRDGVIAATAISLAFLAIFSATSTSDAKMPVSQCQEVVVDVQKKGNVLARCPSGTYIEIVDDNVVCRCGKRSYVEKQEVSEPPPLVFPPLEITPNPEPNPQRDDRGIEL